MSNKLKKYQNVSLPDAFQHKIYANGVAPSLLKSNTLYIQITCKTHKMGKHAPDSVILAVTADPLEPENALV